MKNRKSLRKHSMEFSDLFTHEDILFIRGFLHQQEMIICKIFLDAVNNFDRQKIIEIADAVCFFKDYFKGGLKNSNVYDPMRTMLAMRKMHLEACKQTETVEDAIKYLKALKIAVSDKSRFRRQLREMEYPLDEKRQIRKK